MKGHLRERSPGRWAIVLESRDVETGKRRRKWHSFAGTKREAQVEAARLISAAQEGGTVDSSRVTVAQLLDRFVHDWAEIHVAVATAVRYGSLLDHVRRRLGDRRLQKLTATDLATLYATLVRSGSAPRTVAHVHSVLFQALEQARLWRLVRDNVAQAVKPPPVPDRELPILQPDRARELLELLRGKPPHLLASLALATGMRRNEMLALRWCDVDLDAGRLRVELSLEETTAHGIRAKAPKTRNGRRTISLPAHIVAELRGHWRQQQEHRLALGMGKAPPDSPVLATLEGRRQSPNAVTKAWPRIVAAVGMRGITLHSLRHTHASMLIASGMDILTISRRLGHGSPTITLRVYGHLIHGTDEKAAQVMEAAFGSRMVADGGRKPEKA
jgi:integrase